MEKIISQLFGARDTAHIFHLRTDSFSQHMALGELYDALTDLADTLSEIYQGKYKMLDLHNPEFIFSDDDVKAFIIELAAWAEESRSEINPDDTFILNEWDSVIATIFRTKYKLERFTKP